MRVGQYAMAAVKSESRARCCGVEGVWQISCWYKSGEVVGDVVYVCTPGEFLFVISFVWRWFFEFVLCRACWARNIRVSFIAFSLSGQFCVHNRRRLAEMESVCTTFVQP